MMAEGDPLSPGRGEWSESQSLQQLKDMVMVHMQNSGSLADVQAHLQAAVFLAMDEMGAPPEGYRLPVKLERFFAAPHAQLLVDLMRECFRFTGSKNTDALFVREARLAGEKVDLAQLRAAVGVTDASQPILLSLLGGVLAQRDTHAPSAHLLPTHAPVRNPVSTSTIPGSSTRNEPSVIPTNRPPSALTTSAPNKEVTRPPITTVAQANPSASVPPAVPGSLVNAASSTKASSGREPPTSQPSAKSQSSLAGLPALPGGTRAAMPAPTTTTQAASTAAGTAKGSEVPTSLATGRATAAAPAVKASEVPTSQMKAQTTSTVAAVKAKEGTPKDTSQTPATHAVRHVTLPSTAAPRSIAAPGGGSGTFLTQEDDDGDDDGAGAGQLARVRDVAHRITSLGKTRDRDATPEPTDEDGGAYDYTPPASDADVTEDISEHVESGASEGDADTLDASVRSELSAMAADHWEPVVRR